MWCRARAALFVLALVVRSGRLLLIPVLNIVGSILCSFAIVYPIARDRLKLVAAARRRRAPPPPPPPSFDTRLCSVVSFAPSMMMSVTLAMGIDYSLFLITRFREEVRPAAPDVYICARCMYVCTRVWC